MTEAACGDGLYPVTIVRSRYGGAYEPGAWLAWPRDANRLPLDWDGDDIPCRRFWESEGGVVGAGNSPQAAYEDLLSKAAQDG